MFQRPAINVSLRVHDQGLLRSVCTGFNVPSLLFFHLTLECINSFTKNTLHTPLIYQSIFFQILLEDYGWSHPLFLWNFDPILGHGLSFRGFVNTLMGHTTLGRTPLDEWSARRRNLYLTTRNTHMKQTSMTPAGFEPAIPESERPQTHSLHGAVSGTSILRYLLTLLYSKIHNICILCMYKMRGFQNYLYFRTALDSYKNIPVLYVTLHLT
jgi:hypothetical protein